MAHVVEQAQGPECKPPKYPKIQTPYDMLLTAPSENNKGK
jgi:hypothetical protein